MAQAKPPKKGAKSGVAPAGRPQALAFAASPAALGLALVAWYQRTKRDLPWRRLWRDHGDPYHVWVSEIMLQQTVIKAMIPVYARFLDLFPNVASLARAETDAVREAVRGLGYYRRFRFLHEAAQELTAKVDWAWPTTYDGWLELPGVGAYTAAAVSSICFDQPHAVIDGNVERVLCRLLDHRGAPNEPALKRQFTLLAAELLDHGAPGDFNQGMMELGQTVCTVQTPACAVCPLQFGCLALERGSQALAPGLRLKGPEPKDVTMRLNIWERDGKVALVPRPSDARFLRGSLGFATLVANSEGQLVCDGTAEAGPIEALSEAVGVVRHSITHHKIRAEVHRAAATSPTAAGVRWVSPHDVERQLVSNLDRKAWHLYEKALASTAPEGSRRGQQGQLKFHGAL